MTINTSRRAVLAGAAALPSLALPAIGATVEADPIFAAIERHRAAETAFSDLLHRKSQLEERHPDISRKEFPGMPLGDLKYQLEPGLEIAVTVRTQQDINNLMRAAATKWVPKWSRAKIKKVEAPLRAELRRQIAEYKAARAAASLDAMDRAEDEYCDREMEAAEAVLSCQPTTRAGLAAFLDYVVEFQSGRDDADQMKRALETAATAVKAIA